MRDLKAVWLLVAATFVVFLNETTMGVALRSIMDDLDIEAREGQWVTTAFMLTLAVVIPLTSWLIERLTTRQVFGTAMGLFCLGTVVAATAPGLGLLVFGRIVQASGTAMMLPLCMTTLMTVVPATQRGAMMGNVSLVISAAPAIGPTLSGVILGVVGWRGIFWAMLPVALVMATVGLRLLTNVTEAGSAHLDLLSVPLAAVGFGGLVYGLSQVGGEAAGTAGVFGGVGLVALVAFVVRQLVLSRHDKAMLDLRPFRRPQFTVALLIMVSAMASLFGVVIVLPLYLLGSLHLSPVDVGLLLLPGSLLMGLLGRPVGGLYDRFGPRPLVLPGVVVTSAAVWSLTFIGAQTSRWQVMASHVVLSLGLALVFTPLFTSSLSSVPRRLYSHASAILGSIQQVAGAAGTALAVTVMSGVETSARASGLSSEAAVAAGVRAAFVGAAVLSLLPVVAALFVVRPQPEHASGAPLDVGHG